MLCTMSSATAELNFSSLPDDSGCIAVPDTMILYILYAHVRANANFNGGYSSINMMSR